MNKLYLLFVLAILTTLLPIYEAQAKVVASTKESSSNNNEVTLTVAGTGNTKEEATVNALRSALEQTYGVFVSSNTSIINDELVQDAVSTITNNCVKSYKELLAESLPNGSWYVTLQATVSISGLVSYAQSKGSSVEFAGNTFGMNMKIQELNRQNEIRTIENLINQLIALDNLFDYELIVGEPKNSDSDYYESEFKVNLLFNDNTRTFNELLFQVLNEVALSDAEKEEYRKTNTPYYIVGIPNPENSYNVGFCLRNDYDKLMKNIYRKLRFGSSDEPGFFASFFESLMNRKAVCFKISDNLHDPTNLKYHKGEGFSTDDNGPNPWMYGLFRYYNYKKLMKVKHKNGIIVGHVWFDIYIPKADISKYSNFEVKPIEDVNLHNMNIVFSEEKGFEIVLKQ